MVQKVIIIHIDKKLRGGGINHIRAGHGQRSGIVGQAISGFVFDGRLGRLLLHGLGKASPPGS